MSDKRLERDYERICSMILDGTVSDEDVTVAVNNLFYERFGMSACEIQAELGMQLSQKL